MAFKNYFGVEDSYPVLKWETPSELIHRIPFGQDEVSRREVSILVHLMTNPPFEGPVSYLELLFSVLVEENGEFTHIDDGLRTKELLDAGNRQLALRVICMETNSMVKHRNPDVLTMSTLTPGLPEKALHKYEVVSRAICAAGYRGGRGNSFKEDQIWMFEKSA
ncbi:MAG TPA: hypothetical protein PLH11_04345 [Gemmobacter sp.]|mgnify:CR=1 FL=1|nr:hypothetical protein [Gemmobacter sp.]